MRPGRRFPSRSSVVQSVIDVCHRLGDRGFVAATDGNVSARLNNGSIVITRAGIPKGLVTSRDLVEISPGGEVIRGRFRPSTEVAMHLFIYKERPDVRAVAHAHPPAATGFAVARIPLDANLFPELILSFGMIPLADYATPSTAEVAASIAPFVHQADAVLLTNHGVVTFGADPMDAYYKMEKVEHAARCTLVAQLLGGGKALSNDDVRKLKEAEKAVEQRFPRKALHNRRNH